MRTDLLQRLLVNFDVGASGSLMRVALGMLLVPALTVLRPDPGMGATAAALLTMLFAVKVVAAVARRLLPATNVVRSHWEWRRTLARYYDSYQWRKLCWIGAGLLISGALGWPGTTAQWALGAACILAGIVAEIVWRRHRLALAPPEA